MAAFTLASAFTGPITSPVTPTSAHARSEGAGKGLLAFPASGGGWGVSGACASISATLVAIVGRAVNGSRRKAQRVQRYAFDPTKEVGVLEPTGFWDPLHLTREGFKNPKGAFKSKETFDWYRAAELKHGRISMVAITGYWFGTFAKWPGFEEVPSGMGALDTSQGGAGLGAIILAAGMCELYFFKQDPTKEPGDLGDPAGLVSSGAGTYSLEARNQELAHCRLAMSGIITTFIFEYFGKAPFSQFKLEEIDGGTRGALLLLGVAWYCTLQADQFYIADDAGIDGPAYQVGAGRAYKQLEQGKKALSAGKVLEKSEGRWRFAAA